MSAVRINRIMAWERFRENGPREHVEFKTKYVSIVLLSALIVAFESVAIEGALNIEDLDVILVTAVPSLIGGLILMSVRPPGTASFCRSLGRKGWPWMILLCALVAGGILLWFDAVGRIGAGKEALLGGGSSEVLFVVILSTIFLSERLSRIEAVGGLMIVVGVFLVLMNADTMSLALGFGEIEAIISSFLLGCSVVLTASMLKAYDLAPLSGVELFLSGTIVLAFGVSFSDITWPGISGLLLLLLLGLFPAVGLLSYNAGLPKIGASLTSVLFALNGILTVGVQLLVLAVFPEADFMPPENLALAMIGGVIAFVGVYLLNLNPTSESSSATSKS